MSSDGEGTRKQATGVSEDYEELSVKGEGEEGEGSDFQLLGSNDEIDAQIKEEEDDEEDDEDDEDDYDEDDED